jgi:hexulose-6-phosphate isomerase
MQPTDSNRRDFLKAGGMAITAAAIGATAPAPVVAEESPLDVGRHIYKSLKWGMIRAGGTTLEKFKLLKELGYDGVELDSPGGVEKQEALAASRETGLPIEGLVCSTHWDIRHSDPDPKVRAQALTNMQTALADAKLVGGDSVLLVPGKVTDEEHENHDQVWERSITEIKKLLPLAEEIEIRILIENVGNGFCYDPKLLAQYMDEIDSPWVGVQFDIGNHIWVSPPAEWIRVLGMRIRKLDVKDRTKDRQQRPIGEGEADWPAVRAALAEIGYRGWAAAEVTGGDRDHLADVLARMNQVLGKSDGKPAKNLPGATQKE